MNMMPMPMGMNPMNPMMMPIPLMPNKILIRFQAITGVNYNMSCNYGLTVSEVFKEYLIRINKEFLFDNNTNKIEFIYNGKAINFKNNNERIEQFFGDRPDVIIQIITNDLIG